jgi:ubiquinone/menaquinone biosynthesis C-methylase UbiE
MRHDIRRLPYAANSVDRIAAIHVLEHFYQWEAPLILADWYRVLVPGGQLILELPCLDKIFDYIRDCMQHNKAIWLAFTLHAFWGDPQYHDPAMCHKWGYSVDSLSQILRTIGFVEVKEEVPNYHFEPRDMRLTAVKGGR